MADISVDQLITLISVGTLFATMLGALGTVRGLRDQLFLQTFTEYTRRYADVLDRLPFDAGRPSAEADLSRFPKEAREDFLKTMRRYFNLCWEELHLHKCKRINKATWQIWRTGIEDTLRSPHFRAAWEELRTEYTSAPDFVRFVDRATEWTPAKPILAVAPAIATRDDAPPSPVPGDAPVTG